MRNIPQMEPLIEQADKDAVNEYMNSGGWLTEHTKTKEFAQAIADYTKAKHCYIMSNGTVSLTTALWACGLVPGDEVLVPAFTMVASANAAVLMGCSVKFVDIEPVTMCMDVEKTIESIGPKTKAIIFVSINGRCPTSLFVLQDYCREHGIWLIEDAAQSLGSTLYDYHLGTIGDIGSFSFSMPKIITTGQGGALVTNNDALAAKIHKLRDFGREAPGADHYITQGWNFKFTDLQAVIGLSQMKRLAERVAAKKRMWSLYEYMLGDLEEIIVPVTDLDDTTPWFVDILLSNRIDRGVLQGYLKDHGCGSREFYPCLPHEPVFNQAGRYPNAERVAACGLWLPSALTLTDQEIIHVCKLIASCFGHKCYVG